VHLGSIPYDVCSAGTQDKPSAEHRKLRQQNWLLNVRSVGVTGFIPLRDAPADVGASLDHWIASRPLPKV
jgi:hypothetical protein